MCAKAPCVMTTSMFARFRYKIRSPACRTDVHRVREGISTRFTCRTYDICGARAQVWDVKGADAGEGPAAGRRRRRTGARRAGAALRLPHPVQVPVQATKGAIRQAVTTDIKPALVYLHLAAAGRSSSGNACLCRSHQWHSQLHSSAGHRAERRIATANKD